MKTRSRILYLSHGGGPLPLLGDEGHREMVDQLEQLATRLVKPSAIIVISAHWEESRPTITGAMNPALIYDYYGFPAESYDIEYPATGEPSLAQLISTRLIEAGFNAVLDGQRGFDHGLFVPLKIMYPQADIPCLQLSMLKSLDASEHIRMGEALAELPADNLLVIGSGFSFHNMKAFFSDETDESRLMNESFEKWLIDTCSSHHIDENERKHRLENWEMAPAARYCHPREEHLLPLHVCYGMARRASTEVISLKILGKYASMYLW